MSPMTPEQQAEIARQVAENRARQEAMTATHRIEAGEIDIELVRASDDPHIRDRAFQGELNAFSKALRDGGLNLSQIGMALDSAIGEGYPLAEFVIKNLALPLVAAAAHVCASWVKARNGRKLRIKIGQVVVEGQTEEEITRLLKQAAEFLDKHPPKARKAKAELDIEGIRKQAAEFIEKQPPKGRKE